MNDAGGSGGPAAAGGLAGEEVVLVAAMGESEGVGEVAADERRGLPDGERGGQSALFLPVGVALAGRLPGGGSVCSISARVRKNTSSRWPMTPRLVRASPMRRAESRGVASRG